MLTLTMSITIICALATLPVLLSELVHRVCRRRLRRLSAWREWTRRTADVREWEARACPYDSGVQVDEAAWADIVERLKETPSG
ncbi:hypothetical protein [Actinomadura macrotermitis]|uniref:Uncharacterized protein n=1 Tax=Actinomadura macrotermitis TaxID=2585200 RepID=A0A7K0BLQ9_9ACTN|nr:hypothetical protein [Actinomadura macrotermitis]MQY02115.1 hypothetical protein [Actinomadura macrotermitis]